MVSPYCIIPFVVHPLPLNPFVPGQYFLHQSTMDILFNKLRDEKIPNVSARTKAVMAGISGVSQGSLAFHMKSTTDMPLFEVNAQMIMNCI